MEDWGGGVGCRSWVEEWGGGMGWLGFMFYESLNSWRLCESVLAILSYGIAMVSGGDEAKLKARRLGVPEALTACYQQGVSMHCNRSMRMREQAEGVYIPRSVML